MKVHLEVLVEMELVKKTLRSVCMVSYHCIRVNCD